MKSPWIDQMSLRCFSVMFCFCRLKPFRFALKSSPLRSSLLTSCSRLRVGYRNSWSLPNSFAVPSANVTMKCSPLCGVHTLFALSLRGWISDASTFSNSSMSATRISPFQVPRAINAYPRNLAGYNFPHQSGGVLDWSSEEIGSYSNHCPKKESLGI